MQTVLKIRLHVISPIHIGCDDVYEPTRFIVDEQRNTLVEFDPLSFVKALSPDDREQFSRMCMSADVRSVCRVWSFINDRRSKITGRHVEIASGLPDHYRKVLDEKERLNQFVLSRTAYSPFDQLPYVPGSSVKGTLRTAYLTMLAEERNITGKKHGDSSADLEAALMEGTLEKDPFRMVQISDFLPSGPVRTKVLYSVNKEKVPSGRGADPYQMAEVIKPGCCFEGCISISQPYPRAGIKRPVDPQLLMKSVNDFYRKRWTEEKNVLTRIGVHTDTLTVPAACLLRIGRHAGAESLTIEGNRDILIKPKKARGNRPARPEQWLPSALTVWLASEFKKSRDNAGLLPFGWAVLEDISDGKSVLSGILPQDMRRANAAPEQTVPKPPKPVSDFEPFKQRIEEMDLTGRDWGSWKQCVEQVKRMSAASDRMISAKYLRSRIEAARTKKKDYLEDPLYLELKQLSEETD